MTAFRSDFIRTVVERDYMHQCTDLEALDLLASERTVTAYIGFDCTAPSLHAGSLVSIMLLRKLQQCGHKPIVLMGGGTTKVGDPSGKDKSREMLSEEKIAANMAGIRKVFAKFLTFGDGAGDAVMVDNADWLDELEYIRFLREFGPHFSINRMLGFDSVKDRLNQKKTLSFLEFNYMILQAYDFLELSRRLDCRLQMGGSDQWGNIVNGVELARRIDGDALFGLTTPLLESASGAKMGKSERGAVWLDADMWSPYKYWQFWRNTEDADVGRFLRLFTELPLERIAEEEKKKDEALDEAKELLAYEATRLCHGEAAARKAAEDARKFFEAGVPGEGAPTFDVPRGELESGIPTFKALVVAELARSNKAARQFIKDGGARLNGTVIAGELQPITLADANADGIIWLSVAKNHALLRVV